MWPLCVFFFLDSDIKKRRKVKDMRFDFSASVKIVLIHAELKFSQIVVSLKLFFIHFALNYDPGSLLEIPPKNMRVD